MNEKVTIQKIIVWEATDNVADEIYDSDITINLSEIEQLRSQLKKIYGKNVNFMYITTSRVRLCPGSTTNTTTNPS